MKLNKTEQKLMNKLNSSDAYRNCISTEGKRENNAARSLEKKGLVKFTNHSEYVPPTRSHIRQRNGDYVGYWSLTGIIEKI